MTVDGNHRAVDIRHPLLQVPNDRRVLGRRGVADGVGDVHRGGAGGDRSLDDFAQKIRLGAGGVLGAELDVVAPRLGPFDALDGAGDDLFGRHPQFMFAVDRAGGEEDVDPPARPDGVGGPDRCRRRGSGPSRRSSPDRHTAPRYSARPRSRRGWRRGSRPRSRPRRGRTGPRRRASFSAAVMLHPGDCSPSRSVVSKIVTRSDIGRREARGKGARGRISPGRKRKAPGAAPGLGWVTGSRRLTPFPDPPRGRVAGGRGGAGRSRLGVWAGDSDRSRPPKPRHGGASALGAMNDYIVIFATSCFLPVSAAL